jgi:hypothetical protein
MQEIHSTQIDDGLFVGVRQGVDDTTGHWQPTPQSISAHSGIRCNWPLLITTDVHCRPDV